MDAIKSTILVAMFSLLLAGCDSKTADEADDPGKGNESGARVLIEPEPNHPGLLNPNLAKEKCPETYEVFVETNEGEFEIKVTRAWSEQGADRFYNMVKIGYLDGCRFFRVVEGFVAQFGMHGDPKIYGAWKDYRILDDDPKDERRQNARGTITFAKTGAPNSRTVQLFINLGGNQNLDGMGFTPFGYVTRGMTVVDKLYAAYGDGPPQGTGPAQGMIQAQGNAYLNEKFPQLDYIVRARLVKQ